MRALNSGRYGDQTYDLAGVKGEDTVREIKGLLVIMSTFHRIPASIQSRLQQPTLTETLQSIFVLLIQTLQKTPQVR
jgi:hypothetical protein